MDDSLRGRYYLQTCIDIVYIGTTIIFLLARKKTLGILIINSGLYHMWVELLFLQWLWFLNVVSHRLQSYNFFCNRNYYHNSSLRFEKAQYYVDEKDVSPVCFPLFRVSCMQWGLREFNSVFFLSIIIYFVYKTTHPLLLMTDLYYNI